MFKAWLLIKTVSIKITNDFTYLFGPERLSDKWQFVYLYMFSIWKQFHSLHAPTKVEGGGSHDISNCIYVKLRKMSAANIVGEVEPAPSMLRACVCDVCTRCALEYYNVAKTEVWMNSSISIDPGGGGQMNIWTFVTTTYIVL